MKLDTWLVDGWLQVDHEIGCECARSMPSMHLRRHVQAPDAEQAEATAIREWQWLHASRVDSRCDVYFEHTPYTLNVSQRDREREALRAWNNGEPIRVAE